MNNTVFLQGGAILQDSSITRCQAIVNMISEPSSILSLLTYTSLKGFIYKLDVVNINKALFRYFRYLREPIIQDYLIKLVIIRKDNDDDLPKFRGRGKLSESMDSFINEAKIQNRIWELSTLSSTPNFTPSVIDLSLFEQDVGDNFLRLLKTKVAVGSRDEEVIDYLIGVIQDPANRLGMLVMPFLHNSVTFNDFILSNQANPGLLTDMSINCLSKVVGLYLFNGLLHYDLHMDNILIKNRDGVNIPYVIDFGRVSQVDLVNPDEYFNLDQYLQPNEQVAALKQRNDFRDKLDLLMTHNRRESQANVEVKQIAFIQEVIEYIRSMDIMINQREFKMSTPQSYQMKWISTVIDEPDPTLRNRYLLTIFQTVIHDNTVSEIGTKLSTINTYKRQGILINFIGVSPISFFATPNIPGIVPSVVAGPAIAASPSVSPISQAKTNPVLQTPQCAKEPKASICTMMGGKRSTKKYKKNKKISRQKK